MYNNPFGPQQNPPMGGSAFTGLLSGSPFGGIRIIESPNALEKTKDPVKIHTKKPWMRNSYHQRIQKKWIKRWGWVMKPAIFQTPMGFIAHPQVAQALRRALSR